ncbi:dipeptide/oligopeptide/nickel ABC transporter permease/ATP-binding protein [Endozoicomonas sp. SM1973]|uniref:ABC-type dipeptide transporter n=1 Tax=Spartinivicinus marinus TaxID=2994442 RepID=A0A853I5Y5_9GAMM|nr:dipeptide/oligopeptide/nickel ABC transporter permease/ATP-binding protein [Spartinivicinus marinus]MCX4027790.1 dipeptide/oligopeptide/nickel ABC transporter permease/ATP-binding protein [Spartinivicinus marinus]NYZ69320.1 dipeptide/oligopeptide/nickel ABC transporter permease/ATP-binding protein [Spartinivicinus marinus]
MTNQVPANKTPRPSAWQLFINNRLALIGFVIFLTLLFLALAAPLLPLAPPDETALTLRLLTPFSSEALLGTDHLGRDLLSRLIWGTQVSLMVGVSATLIAAIIGSTIGLLAGYFGGRTDSLLMRGIDMLMAFPYILLALAIVAALGPGLMNALYAIAIVNIPFFARNIRGVTLGLSQQAFIDAARLSGKNDSLILLSEILPNVLPTIVITMTTTIGWMILETAGLSFLGLGAQPPQADLGSMLGEGRKLLFTAPHVSIIPGLMIFVLVMSINLMGDGVRDLLDPRLKSGVMGRPAAATLVNHKNTASKQLIPCNVHGLKNGLQVANLHTEFHQGKSIYNAVNGVSFSIQPGECLGIIGESGSGKSVTAMSISRLVPSPPGEISNGQAWLDNQALFSLPLSQLQQIRGNKVAYVFQDPLSALHPLLTIGEQLIEAIQAHQSISYQAAKSMTISQLKQVKIPNPEQRIKNYPHQLSGGLRQRVVIAMALVNSPNLLIADEPTTALDVTIQAQVLKLLRQLQQQTKVALLFITHDFGLVSAMCDQVAVMYAGHIVETGPTHNLLTQPAHPYTQKLINCVPILGKNNQQLETIEGMPPPMNQLPTGCHFADRCPYAEDSCRQQAIHLTNLTDGHAVRCIKPLQHTLH